MELKGKFVKVLSRSEIKRKDGTVVVNRSGQVLEKMEFLVQVPSSKETFLKVETISNIVMGFISDTSAGTALTLDVYPESREWQGKWFTSVNCNMVQANRNESRSSVNPPNPIDDLAPDDGDLPF